MGGAAAAVVPQHLGLDVLDGLVHGDHHVRRLGQSDQMSPAPLHRNFGNVAVLFDRENDLAFEIFTQDFGEFAEAGFDLVTNGGSYFVLPSDVLYVH